MAVKIITDSTCDIDISRQEKLGTNIVPHIKIRRIR